MPDRTFGSWLVQQWPRAVLLVLTFAFVWIFLMLGLTSSLHQNRAIEQMTGEQAKITTEATRARDEATKTRHAVERIETLLKSEGIGP